MAKIIKLTEAQLNTIVKKALEQQQNIISKFRKAMGKKARSS